MSTVRTRFAPSPTGFLHIGHLRTAMYAYAMAKANNGTFILRVEDTDRQRYIPGSIEKSYETLKYFGLNWNEGPLVGGPYEPYVQSERVKLGLYQEFVDKLLKEKKAYYCFCDKQTVDEIEEEHDLGQIKLRDTCRDLTDEQVKEKLKKGIKPAVRLQVPDGITISFVDFITKKTIKWESRFVDEVMLLKSDGFPTYHLAAMVDDYLMRISHVFRGHGWFPSTPAHLLLMDYLEFPRPEICHLTDILDPEGGKLSKRKGSVSCDDLTKEGYLSEALMNFIMLVGWAPKDNRELFTLDEFVENFNKGSLQVSNPVFDRTKLDWFNGYYIRQKTDSELAELLKPYVPEGGNPELLVKIVPIIKDRLVKLSDLSSFAGFFFTRPKVDPALFGNLDYINHLSKALSYLFNLSDWSNDSVSNSLNSLITQNGWKTGDFYMSLRIALTGSKFTPPITESAVILGKEETIHRLQSVVLTLPTK